MGMELLLLWKLAVRAVLFIVLIVILASATVTGLQRTYHYLRGRRNRDRGFTYIRCKSTAFPVEETTKRYRCWGCGYRFEGPEHF
jgi:hypothetical protein